GRSTPWPGSTRPSRSAPMTATSTTATWSPRPACRPASTWPCTSWPGWPVTSGPARSAVTSSTTRRRRCEGSVPTPEQGDLVGPQLALGVAAGDHRILLHDLAGRGLVGRLEDGDPGVDGAHRGTAEDERPTMGPVNTGI